MAFDAFLVPHDRGTDRRWLRLSVPERWCAVFGVEAIASKAPERGCLLIAAGVPAEAEDYAGQAGVPLAVARSTIAKMRRLGLVAFDSDRGCDYVVGMLAEEVEMEKRRRWAKARQARSAEAAGGFSARQLADRIALYGSLCWICRAAPFEVVDHVIPLARGGANWPANLRPACRRCNSRKGSRWPFRPSMLTEA